MRTMRHESKKANNGTQTIRTAADEFLHYVALSAEYSAQTARAYASDIRQFVGHVEEQMPSAALQDILPADIQRYRETMAQLKPATVVRKLSALSSFFNWLWLRGEVNANPVSAVKRPRKKQQETNWVTAEDTIALMAACRDDRERAILSTYVRAALRYSELMHLKLGDVNLMRDELSILGKGGLRRTVPILSDLRPHLVRWLAARPDMGHDYLFTTRTGHPLYQKACWRLFRSLLRRAGLEAKRYTVHSLRHGAATQMYEAGVDLATIARFLRHSDLSTVGRYVHAGTQAVRREIETKTAGALPRSGARQALLAESELRDLVQAALTEALLTVIPALQLGRDSCAALDVS